MNAERGTRNAERGGGGFDRVLGDLTRNGLFPLTPALSPEGEGRGEGEQSGAAAQFQRTPGKERTHA